jgi:hypothetical protein
MRRNAWIEALKIRPDSVVVKNILSQINSGEIKESIESERRESRKTTESSEYKKSSYISI